MTKHHPTARRVHRSAKDQDAFLAGVLESTSWAQEHGRTLVIGGVTALVLLAAGLYYKNYRNTLSERAASELSTVRATVQSGNLPLARQDLERYVNRFGGTESGEEARLMLGQVLLQSNDAKAAINTLEGLAGDVESGPGYAAAMMLGAAYETDKQVEQAERTYMRVADNARFDFQTREALDRAARLRVERGDLAGAAELYERVVATFEEIETENPQEKNAYQMRLAEVRAQMPEGTRS